LNTTSKFASGLSWNTLTVVLQVVIQLAYTGMLARLVPPSAFMLMGLVLSLMGFAEIFSQVGVGPALVQRKEIHQQHINGAFYTALALGLLFTLSFIIAAPAIARFYQLPELKSITQVVCTSFTISALAVVPRNMMMKEMRFKTMFKAGMISIIGGNLVVGLTLAYLGYGVWAYVWALFAQNTLMTLALWYFQPIRIELSWQWRYTADLMRYGVGSTLFNSLNYLATKLDLMVIPKFMFPAGAAFSEVQKIAAANYERANYAMTQPITIMGKLSESVLFSGMSAMQDQIEKLRTTFLVATNLVALAMWPTATFMYFFAQPLILLWLGQQYHEAAAILEILFLVAVFRTLSKMSDSLLRARDYLMVGSLIKLMYVVCILVGIWLTVPFGMRAIALAVVCATALHYVLNLLMTKKILELATSRLMSAIAPGLILALISMLPCALAHYLGTLLNLGHLFTLFLGLGFWGACLAVIIYQLPWLLGSASINPLTHLPLRIKSMPLIQHMLQKIQKKA
jgi:O-antigen/teichoic acid export membrane protein